MKYWDIKPQPTDSFEEWLQWLNRTQTKVCLMVTIRRKIVVEFR